MSDGAAIPEDIAGSTAREAAAQHPDGASVSSPDAPPVVPVSADAPTPMPTVDHSAEDGAGVDHVEAEAPRITADELGSVLIDAKIESIQKIPAAKRTPEQVALLTAEMYRNPAKPIAQAVYEKYPDGVPIGNLFVTNADGTAMNVTALRGETVSEDKKTKTYSCVVAGKDQPVLIDGGVLSKAHLKANAAHVGKVFGAPDGSVTDQQKLAEWYANGAEGEPPDVDLQAIEGTLQEEASEESEAVGEVNGVIGEQIDRLQKELAAKTMDPESLARLSPPELEKHEATIREPKTNLGYMQLAAETNGTAGALFKYEALSRSLNRSSMGPAEKGVLADTLNNLKPEADAARNELQQLMDRSLPQAKVDEMLKQLKENPLALISSEDFTKLSGFTEAVYGKEQLDIEDARRIDAALENIIEGSDMSEDQKNRLKHIAKGAGLGVALALLLAVGLVGGVTSLAMKGASSAGSRAA